MTLGLLLRKMKDFLREMTTETSPTLALDPVYMTVRPREKDEVLSLFNADEVIHSITSKFEGFAEANRLMSDFRSEFAYYSQYDGAPMPPSEVKLLALIGLLERAYGLDVYTKAANKDELEMDNA